MCYCYIAARKFTDNQPVLTNPYALRSKTINLKYKAHLF